MTKAPGPNDRTIKGHSDDTYEHLLQAHSTLDSVMSCLFGEESDEPTQPVAAGIHAGNAENARLAALLSERIDHIDNRL